MFARFMALGAALIILAGCAPVSSLPFSHHLSANAVSKVWQTREQARLVNETVRVIHQRDYAGLISISSEDLQNEATEEIFTEASKFLPDGSPVLRISLRHVRGAEVTRDGSVNYSHTLEEHWFTGGRAYFKIYLAEFDDGWAVTGFNITPIDEAAVRANLFTLEDKTVYHYGMLALAALSSFVVISAMIAIGSLHGLKRRMPWFLFAAVSFYPLAINWTTGVISPPFFVLMENGLKFQFFQMIFFGAAQTQQFYGPIILSVGFPLGAILFWLCFFTGSLRFREPVSA